MLNPRYSIHRSCVLNASADAVWEEIRDLEKTCKIAFRDQVGHFHWLEGGSARHVPALFRFTLQPGHNQCTEEIVGRSEIDRSITFRTVGSLLQLADYVATIKVTPLSEEAHECVCAWSMEFSLIAGTDPCEFIPAYEALVDRQVANTRDHFSAA